MGPMLNEMIKGGIAWFIAAGASAVGFLAALAEWLR